MRYPWWFPVRRSKFNTKFNTNNKCAYRKMCRLSNRPSKSPLIINAFNISLIWYALHSAVYLMHFPTNAGDSVVLVNVPWPISAHAMSLGQIKLRNWPSHCSGHHARFCIFMRACVHSCRKYISRGIATKLAVQQERYDTCVSSIDAATVRRPLPTMTRNRCQR